MAKNTCDLNNKDGCKKCKNGRCLPCTIARICMVLIGVALVVKIGLTIFG